MNYHNQMVQTGKLNDIDYKLMENVKDSYRVGVEIEVSLPLWTEKLQLGANATFSRNRIRDCTAFFDPTTSRTTMNRWDKSAKITVPHKSLTHRIM